MRHAITYLRRPIPYLRTVSDIWTDPGGDRHVCICLFSITILPTTFLRVAGPLLLAGGNVHQLYRHLDT